MVSTDGDSAPNGTPRKRDDKPTLQTPYEQARPTTAMGRLELDRLVLETAPEDVSTVTMQRHGIEVAPPPLAAPDIVPALRPRFAKWMLLVTVALSAIVIAELVRVFVLER